MTLFQIMMLGASAFFAYKVYEHIQTLQDPNSKDQNNSNDEQKDADTFSPFDPETLIQKADVAFEEGDMKKALALLIEANAKKDNNPDVLFKLGYIMQNLGDNNEAIKYYKESLEVDNNNEFVHNSMASIYRANGEFVSAKMHLTESLEIDSSNAVTYYNYGNLLVDMQHPEEAKEMYKKALEVNPEFSEAKEELEKLS